MKLLTLAIACLTLASCTLSVAPDGTRNYTPDPATFAILSQGVIRSLNSSK